MKKTLIAITAMAAIAAAATGTHALQAEVKETVVNKAEQRHIDESIIYRYTTYIDTVKAYVNGKIDDREFNIWAKEKGFEEKLLMAAAALEAVSSEKGYAAVNPDNLPQGLTKKDIRLCNENSLFYVAKETLIKLAEEKLNISREVFSRKYSEHEKIEAAFQAIRACAAEDAEIAKLSAVLFAAFIKENKAGKALQGKKEVINPEEKEKAILLCMIIESTFAEKEKNLTSTGPSEDNKRVTEPVSREETINIKAEENPTTLKIEEPGTSAGEEEPPTTSKVLEPGTAAEEEPQTTSKVLEPGTRAEEEPPTTSKVQEPETTAGAQEQTTSEKTTDEPASERPEEPAEHVHAWVLEKGYAATCTTAATATYICLTCQNTYSEEIGSANGHNWTVADCVSPSYCRVCGETGVMALGHDWKEICNGILRHYKEPQYLCNVCGYMTENIEDIVYHVDTTCQAGYYVDFYILDWEENMGEWYEGMPCTYVEYIGSRCSRCGTWQ